MVYVQFYKTRHFFIVYMVSFVLFVIFRISSQASEVEETMKRIQSHKGVAGTIVVNSEGNFIIMTSVS
jgi:hypothetical protein